MQRVDLRLELLSPCFLGGAYQQPEFRIASLRGVWRYWYRALYGRGDETQPGDEERIVFGGIAPGGGQDGVASSVRLVVIEEAPAGEPKVWSNPRPPHRDEVDGRGYLFFSMGMQGRSFRLPGERLRLRLIVDEARLQRLADARQLPRRAPDIAMRAKTSLAVACSFSGLGGRSRRLAGAVSLRAPEPPFLSESPKDPATLARRLTAVLTGLRPRGASLAQPPRYHVVADGVFRAGVLKRTFATWEEAAGEVGRSFGLFRRNRQPDKDIARAMVIGGPRPPGTITRAAFGLPIGFRFSAGTVEVTAGRGQAPPGRPTPGRDKDDAGRRGSPLFLSLERLADGRLAVVWCCFGAQLTPDGQIQVGRTAMAAPDLSLIDELLNQDAWASHPVTVR
jgi:hypothetical protein